MIVPENRPVILWALVLLLAVFELIGRAAWTFTEWGRK